MAVIKNSGTNNKLTLSLSNEPTLVEKLSYIDKNN